MPTDSERPSLEIRPVCAADLPNVCAFLTAQLGGKGGAERYRRILAPRWAHGAPNAGFLLESQGSVAGVLGLIYSERRIKGRTLRFCNMSSWCVVEAHRRFSLMLLRSMAEQEGYIFTNFSPTVGVARILERTGFNLLDSGKYILVPPLMGVPSGKVRLLADPRDVRSVLTNDDRALFDDHARYRCGQFALIGANECCHVITVRRGRDGLYFADVLHASEPAMLVDNLALLVLPALRRHATPAIGVDARHFRSRPRFSGLFRRPSYYLGDGIGPDQISSAYSEIVGIYGA